MRTDLVADFGLLLAHHGLTLDGVFAAERQQEQPAT